MNSYITTPIRCSLLLLIIALLVSGCSSSTDSNSEGSQLAADVSGSIEDTLSTDNGSNGNTSELEDATIGDTTTGTQAESTVGENETPSGVSEPSIPDPEVQNFTRVEFSITVPTYQSNALQVRLSWDTKQFYANWIGDELWAASDDFPTNTEHDLVVTFSDDNGDITLGQYISVFRTGTNDSEDYHVLAEQFNIDQWDSDEDGTSNIAELIAETDLTSSSSQYEANIPSARPYYEHEEVEPDFSGTTYVIDTRTINIDASGNGTYLDSFRLSGASGYGSSESGTRTYTGNSVIWSGRSSSFSTGAGRRSATEFTIETTYIDDLTRRQMGNINFNNCCGPIFDQLAETSYTFVGEVIEDTSECAPITGTFVHRYTSPRGTTFTEDNTTTTTVTKEVDDRYWAVSISRPNTVLEQYLVRNLEANFYCDFLELR